MTTGNDGWDPDELSRVAVERGTRLRRRRRNVRRGATGSVLLAALLAAAFITFQPLTAGSHARVNDTSSNGGSTSTISSSPTTSTKPTTAGSATSTAPPSSSTTTEPPTTTVPRTTTTTSGGMTPVISGEVVNQQGKPVAGAAIVDDFTGQLVLTAADGSFSVSCQPQPGWPQTIHSDQLWVASWLPAIYFHDHAAGPVQGPGPADSSAGWTYINAANTFVDDWPNAPVCAQLQSPIKVVLPAAGTLDITGNWPAGTPVSLYWPGLTSLDVDDVVNDPSYGADPPSVDLEFGVCELCENASRSWTVDSSTGASFPALTATGYSVWIGDELVTDCADVQVVAGVTTSYTCSLPSPPATTTTASTTTTPTSTTS